jgi:cytohesin
MKGEETLEQFLKRAAETLFPDGQVPKDYSIHSKASDDDTPLHTAALWGDRHAIELILNAGAHIDAEGDMGCTPLYYAVMQDNLLAAEFLLKSGADPDAMTELDFSPRTLARHKGKKEMVALFRSAAAQRRR